MATNLSTPIVTGALMSLIVIVVVASHRSRRIKCVRHAAGLKFKGTRSSKRSDILTGEARGAEVGIGIVTMMKQPCDFDTWFKHHCHHLGAVHFYICVEDTPDLYDKLKKSYSDKVTVFSNEKTQQAYFGQMNRQQSHVNRSIELARETLDKKSKSFDHAKRVTHLLHIDDDELLYCQNGSDALRQKLAMHNKATCFKISNFEAVYQAKDSYNCLQPFKTTLFNTTPHTFRAYANGKAIGRVGDLKLQSNGPHAFTGSDKRSIEIPTDTAVVLHYESHCVPRWRKKFEAYARDTPDACKHGAIPFEYYCNSISAFVKKPSSSRASEISDDIWHKYTTMEKMADRAAIGVIDIHK